MAGTSQMRWNTSTEQPRYSAAPALSNSLGSIGPRPTLPDPTSNTASAHSGASTRYYKTRAMNRDSRQVHSLAQVAARGRLWPIPDNRFMQFHAESRPGARGDSAVDAAAELSGPLTMMMLPSRCSFRRIGRYRICPWSHLVGRPRAPAQRERSRALSSKHLPWHRSGDQRCLILTSMESAPGRSGICACLRKLGTCCGEKTSPQWASSALRRTVSNGLKASGLSWRRLSGPSCRE